MKEQIIEIMRQHTETARRSVGTGCNFQEYVLPKDFESIADKIALKLSNSNTCETATPSRKDLIECIQNLMGVFDTPIARRRYSSNFVDEVRKSARNVMELLEQNNFA